PRAYGRRSRAAARPPRLRPAAGRADRARLRRRRQPLLQPFGPAAVRHAGDPRRDAAPATLPAPPRGDRLAPPAAASVRHQAEVEDEARLAEDDGVRLAEVEAGSHAP